MSLYVGIERAEEKAPEKYFKVLFRPDLKRVPSESESGVSQFCRFALYCAYMDESCCSSVCRQFAAVVIGFILKYRILQHRSQCVSIRPKHVLILYRTAYSKFHLLSFILFPTFVFSYISYFVISSSCLSVPVRFYFSICDLSSTYSSYNHCVIHYIIIFISFLLKLEARFYDRN